MQIEDYPPTARSIDDTPDRRASQRVAAQKRSLSPTDERPTTNVTRLVKPVALIAAAVLLIGFLSYGLSRPHVPLQLAPTVAPAQTFVSSSVRSPAPTAAPQPTEAPHSTPVPTEALLAAPDAPAQTGRGLTIENAAPTPEQAAASDYIANVGAQEAHDPRGDGQPGPNGGDWAAVPTAEPAMLQVIGNQAPHKVR